ncbi:hypothetical protein EB093_07730 [bacterium]|nr:hypothetical protein [bacterium]
MQQKNKTVDPAIRRNYFEMIERTIHSVDALIYELENEGLHNATLREQYYELAVDCVPLIKKLSEARRYAEGTLTHFR